MAKITAAGLYGTVKKPLKAKSLESAIYFIVRLDIEHRPETSIEDVIDEVQANCNYSFKYRKNGMHIVNTEICGTTNDNI